MVWHSFCTSIHDFVTSFVCLNRISGNDKTLLALAAVFAKKLRHCFGLHIVIHNDRTFLPKSNRSYHTPSWVETWEKMAEAVSARDCIDSTIPVFPIARIPKMVGTIHL